MKRGRNQGFTLIELMVVVAIIAILSAIAIPQFSQYLRKAQDTAVIAMLYEIGSREREYRLAKGRFIGCSVNPATPNGIWTDTECWQELKFVPRQKTYGYQFRIEGTSGGFKAIAKKDGEDCFMVDNLSYEVKYLEDKTAK